MIKSWKTTGLKKGSPFKDARHLLANIGAMSPRVLALSLLLTRAASVLLGADPLDVAGAYSDPKHPGHLRHIRSTEGQGSISSTDDGKEFWKVPIVEKDGKVTADFSAKGGPKDLVGEVTKDSIKWSDGNVWELMSARGLTAQKCKILCQRFGFKALGKAFADINMPQPCVPKCDEVYPEA